MVANRYITHAMRVWSFECMPCVPVANEHMTQVQPMNELAHGT
jgi:hypothetical protein